MSIARYISLKKTLQANILEYLSTDIDVEENFQNIVSSIYDQQILEDRNELKSFLYLILNIANNHSRFSFFNSKCENILQLCKNSMTNLLSHNEIFDIFQNSKRILLYLIQEKIIKINDYIHSKISSEQYENANYKDYFLPEISIYNNTQNDQLFEKNFDKQRKEGENDHTICKIIRNDLIDDFKDYIYRNNTPYDSRIENSIFETNSYLIGKNPTLIEYAAFFGSIKIFKYLKANNAELSNSIWIYGIHSKNAEILRIIDENQIKPDDLSYEECLEESIKCHHNEIADYIINNLLDNDIEMINRESIEDGNIISYSLHYYNYYFIPKNLDNKYIFHYLCKYDHFELFKIILSKKQIDIPSMIKYAKKNGKCDFYNLLIEQSNQLNQSYKSVPNSTNYKGLNITLKNNTMNIGNTEIIIMQLKENYFLGLHEAFSIAPNEKEFIKTSKTFKKIVDSNIDDEYNKIAVEINKNLPIENESLETYEQLENLITILCPHASKSEIINVINNNGGMINYIIPIMNDNNYLSPQNRTIEITDPFISAGLILFYHEIVNSYLFKTTPFQFWKILDDESLKLSYIARSRILRSNNPSIIMLFGKGRTGKSTIASYLISGMKTDMRKTIFKSAASIEPCTHNINALGPLKCKELATTFDLLPEKIDDKMNKDIFIVDSEGLDSYEETPWLQQALYAMLPINTISFYVSTMYDKEQLQRYTQYLNLSQFIGETQMNHGFGFIKNIGTFDGNNVIDQLLFQNEKETKKIIERHSDSMINFDESHFRYFTILLYLKHRMEFFISVKELARFIINICINDGISMSGDILIEMFEKFADVTTQNQYLKNPNQTFETIFLNMVGDKMKTSICDQKPLIEKEVSMRLEPILIQDMCLDIDSCVSEINQDGLIKNVLATAINNTLPDIPIKYPTIIEASKLKVIEIIKDCIITTKQKIIDKKALEVPDLGSGFSITDGSFKMKVFDLKIANHLYEKNLGNNVYIAYRLPDCARIEFIPNKYQNTNYAYNSSIDEFVSQIVSKLGGSGNFGISLSSIGFERAKNFANSLFGLTFSGKNPETLIDISVNVNSIAQVSLNNDIDLKRQLTSDLKILFNELESLLEYNDIDSTEVRDKAIEIFSNYGEFVATKFLIGNYELDISHSNELVIQSGGKNALSSSRCRSSGFNLFGIIQTEDSNTNEKSDDRSTHSITHKKSSNHTIISCGSSTSPASFMYDITENKRYGSSFVPISKFAPKSIENVLNYWVKRWNCKPRNVREYLFYHDINSLPTDEYITFYHDNTPFDLYVNKNGKIILPDSKIVYHYYYKYRSNIKNNTETYDIIIDPEDMAIGNLTQSLFIKRWQISKFYHRRPQGNEYRTLSIQLGPLWKFDSYITKAFFTGSAVNYIILNNSDPHYFSLEFETLPEGSGKDWEVGPYYVQLQNEIKIKLA